MIKKINIPAGEVYLKIIGEGICDYCGEVITEIIHTENFGDICDECLKNARIIL